MMERPRVLLVEDDSSLRRFVGMALDELPIELISCPDVDTALAEMGRRTVALIISDLMLPGRSGFELIEALAAAPALLGPAKIVVFSAGLTPAVRARLQGDPVWRLLHKPCSVAALEACVREAVLGDRPAAAIAPAKPADDEDAVARHFGGNRALYQSFLASCLAQFALDIQTGDQACAAGDAQALRRLAHSLKSVLLTLGHEQAAAQARRLEDSADAGDESGARALWQLLRASLQVLRGVHADPPCEP